MQHSSLWARLVRAMWTSFQYGAYCRLAIACLGGGALVCGTVSTPLYAYDPTPVLKNLYGAKVAVLEIYRVKAPSETAFLNAMVSSGPFSKLLTGFVNERILESAPTTAQDGSIVFTSIGRYLDLGTADSVDSQRVAAIQPFLAAPPVRMEVGLVEHLLGNWAWESGSGPKDSFVRAVGLKDDRIFRENISSLSFFKAGYCGQVGMLEVFPEGTALEHVRATVGTRRALSGASIFSVNGKDQYVVYSEFFRTPTEFKTKSFTFADGASPSASGAQAGVVVQNYIPR